MKFLLIFLCFVSNAGIKGKSILQSADKILDLRTELGRIFNDGRNILDFNQSIILANLENAIDENVKHETSDVEYENSKILKTLRQPKQRPHRPRPTRTRRTRP
jgi:hypothetical protein